MAIGLRRKFASAKPIWPWLQCYVYVTATFYSQIYCRYVLFFLTKVFLFIAVHTRDGKLVSSSKFPIGLMISGKIYTNEFVVVLCGVKPQGVQRPRAGYFGNAPAQRHSLV
jgi:hypothetical protein